MGRTLKALGSLPMPLRVAWLTCFGVILVTGVGPLVVPRDVVRAAIPFAFGLVGLAAFFLGTILATDYRGSASATARLSAVGTGSLLRVFLRVFGAGFMVVGALFVASFVVVVFVRPS
jgi:hypothetical protein